MKDPAHHQEKTQRKAIREARREETEKAEEKPETPEVESEEQEGIEIEEQPTLKRPLNRRFH